MEDGSSGVRVDAEDEGTAAGAEEAAGADEGACEEAAGASSGVEIEEDAEAGAWGLPVPNRGREACGVSVTVID